MMMIITLFLLNINDNISKVDLNKYKNYRQNVTKDSNSRIM